MPSILLYCHKSDLSGAPKSLLNVIKGLLEYDSYKIYLYISKADELSLEFQKLLGKSSVFIYSYHQCSVLNKISEILFMIWVLMKIKPSFVIINTCSSLRFQILNIILSTKYCIIFRERFNILSNGKIKLKIRLFFLRFCKNLIFLSKIDRDWWRKFIKFENSEIIPNSIDWNSFSFDYTEKTKNAKKMVGICATLSERKGGYILPKILSKLNPNYKFIIIGDFYNIDDKKRFFDELKKLNVNLTILITGMVKNPLKYMRNCDFMIMPSLDEAQPRVVMECAALKIPIVCFPAGGTASVLPINYPLITKDFELNSFLLILEGLMNQFYDIKTIRKEMYQHISKFTVDKQAAKFDRYIRNYI